MVVKKILLLNPPFRAKQSWLEDIGSFPLGLAYIAAALKQKGYDVEILDCYIEDYENKTEISGELIQIGMSDEAIIDAVRKSAPDIVGISIPFSCQLASALRINSLIKSSFPGIVTIAGGNHVSAVPETFGTGTFDYLILGEGEWTLPGIINTICNNENPQMGLNVIRPSFSKTLHKASIKTSFIEDLDSLPFAAYEMLPLKKYWAMRGGRRYVNMITTRGCSFNCVFCSIHSVMGRKLRRRSVGHVLREINVLKEKFDIQEIWFEDDNLTVSMSWAKSLFEGIIQRNYGLHLYFRNGLRTDRVDLELLNLIKKAGGKKVWFAPESGSQETLDKIIDKNMRLADVEKAVRLSKKVGLAVVCFLVIGFPEESMKDIRKTIKYGEKLKRLGCDAIWISCVVPYPGTRLYSQCIQKGIISEDIEYQSLSTMDSVISNDSFTAGELKAIRDKAMLKLNAETSLKFRVRQLVERMPLGHFSLNLYRRLHDSVYSQNCRN